MTVCIYSHAEHRGIISYVKNTAAQAFQLPQVHNADELQLTKLFIVVR
ncbi:hypothetical protein [Pseudomonas sp. 8 R 14]|nr:hypothetical protein [Pseudomonas sp. 8 R 14]SAM31703.1 hypothetical protein BN1864_LIB5394:01750 [Pseudomonas sp. 1 R 17]